MSKYWHSIGSFQECFDYVSKSHAIPQIKSVGWIPNWQSKVCDLCDRIRNASNNNTWYFREFKSFKVHFNRKNHQFIVQTIEGSKSKIAIVSLD